MDSDSYQTLEQLDTDYADGSFLGEFSYEGDSFRAQTANEGYSVWFGVDSEPEDALETLQKWYRPNRNMYASRGGNSFNEMDSHASHMYDFDDYQAVKALTDDFGFLWMRTPDSYFEDSEHSAAIFTNSESFNYDELWSTEPVMRVLPDLVGLNENDTIVGELRGFVRLDPGEV